MVTSPPGPRAIGLRAAWLPVVLSTFAAACSGTPTGPSGPSAGTPTVDCAVFPDSRTAMYVLPTAVGRTTRVNRTFGHYTPGNGGVGLYAIDLDMPLGTPVHAARAGVVAAVEERFADDDRATFHENWVMVRHADGTVARYVHITRDGALVDVGEPVTQGQVIALSGNSGPSTGPHLHFDVQSCGPNLPPGYNDAPCGMTVPVSFRNTTAETCGLTAGSSYTAAPFAPDAR